MTVPSASAIPLAALIDALGEETVRVDLASRDAVRTDRSVWAHGACPAAVVCPRSERDVSTALRWSTRHGVPVVVRGAGTGLSGGAEAVANGIVLDMSKMDRIIEVSAQDGCAVVQPGVLTAALDRAAGSHGLTFAPDPASAEISTVGGNIATNAGGLRCVKYGTTRDAVLGLRVVLADGEAIALGTRTRKNVTGLDLVGLLVGSEGTLGVIVEATVRLIPRPSGHRMLLIACDALATVQAALAAVAESGVTPSMAELLDRGALDRRDPLFLHRVGVRAPVAAVLLVETDGPGAAAESATIRKSLERHGIEDARPLDPSQREAAYALRRGRVEPNGTDAQVPKDASEWWLGEDMTVPLSRMAEYFAETSAACATRGVDMSLVAHVADGNLHPSLTIPHGNVGQADAERMLFAAADDLVRLAVELGGSVTGEHGIGRTKRRWLPLQAPDRVQQLYAGIKHVFDPEGILGPDRALQGA